MKFIDLSGHKFGRLTVLFRIVGTNPIEWQCLCECGESSEVLGSLLRGGITKSCGCLSKELSAKRLITHGQHDAPEYKIWTGIKKRCLNPKYIRFADYGGRGITICQRWMNYENFISDMGPRPYPKAQIDRIDNNGIYEPLNCRWTNALANSRNKRNNHIIEFKGKIATVTEWADITGIGSSTIRYRLKKGWSVKDALTLPVLSQR